MHRHFSESSTDRASLIRSQRAAAAQ